MKTTKYTIPTHQSLANAALRYLARYAASEASLRRVMENALKRAALRNRDGACDESRQSALRASIEQIIDHHRKTGALSDESFAEVKVHGLRRLGRSRRAIVQKLASKGVSGAIINAALEQSAEGASPEDTDRAAALALARRRKLGPFRKAPADESQRRKDFTALARAGFSLHIAREVLKSDVPEAWE
jgi:regulatory protein